MKVVWQLPVLDSTYKGELYVHPNAKYHAFINNISLCGKYKQNTDSYETSIEESELNKMNEHACKKCTEKYKHPSS